MTTRRPSTRNTRQKNPHNTDANNTRNETTNEAITAWAENDMTLNPNSTTALRGTDAAAHGRATLLQNLGNDQAIERAVRGRKTLGQNKPAGRSPKRQVTVPADLDARATTFIEAGGAPDFSALARTALNEYLTRHGIPA